MPPTPRRARCGPAWPASSRRRMRPAMCRWPPVGPRGGAQSMLGDRVIPAALAGKTATVLGDPDQPHTFTYLPDIGEGLAVLGEHPDAPGEVWHLPNDPHTQTTRQLVDTIYQLAGQPKTRLRSTPALLLRALGVV